MDCLTMAKRLECRLLDEVATRRFKDDGIITATSLEQEDTEEAVLQKLTDLHALLAVDDRAPRLLTERHKDFLFKSLTYLSYGYQCLDASRTWLTYWILHSLSLLSVKLDATTKSNLIHFLGRCQHESGGFGGGPGQLPHLAATYAAVNALVILATPEAFNVINRENLQSFLWRLKQPDGSFTMHVDGEIDIRGVYCALAVASLTNIQTDALFTNTADWIVHCQTYEGGFGGCPGSEAHGGYSFCGLAGLFILRKGHLCNVQSLLRWTVNRQMKLEGGFQGRTNKLVDSCYSFWQGSTLNLVYYLKAQSGNYPLSHLYDDIGLQEYILACCQHPHGGLIDKPGKDRDNYHTCYSLSGLSLAQWFGKAPRILGTEENELECTHPVYNIRPDYVKMAQIYFNQFNVPY